MSNDKIKEAAKQYAKPAQRFYPGTGWDFEEKVEAFEAGALSDAAREYHLQGGEVNDYNDSGECGVEFKYSCVCNTNGERDLFIDFMSQMKKLKEKNQDKGK